MNHYPQVEAYILAGIDASGYDAPEPVTDQEKLQFLADTFKAEYGWAIPRYGVQGAVREWLAGLPSSCNVEFRNHAILQLAETWGLLPKDASEKKQDDLLLNWFNFMAMRIVSMWSRHGIKQRMF